MFFEALGVGPAQDRHVRQQEPLEALLPGALGDLRHFGGADEVLNAATTTYACSIAPHSIDMMMYVVGVARFMFKTS